MKYKLNAIVKLLRLLINVFNPRRIRSVYEYLLELEQCKEKLVELERVTNSDDDTSTLDRYRRLYFDIHSDVQNTLCANIHE